MLDWLSGCVGPAAVDVSHFRVNLAMDVGLEAADRFLAACRSADPDLVWEPAWDVIVGIDFLPFWGGPDAVAAWRWDDRPPQETRALLEGFLAAALRRM